MTGRRVIVAAALVLAVALSAMAKTVRLSFPKGATGTRVEGSISGDASVDYVLSAGKGQTLKVGMTTDNGAAYFNVFEPGKKPGDAALFIGSTGGNSFEGTLPAKGDYTIQVYLMRSAARRGEKAVYTLTVDVTGSPHADLGTAPAGDAGVAGGRHHATAKAPCSMGHAPAGSTGGGSVKASRIGDTWSIEVSDYEHYVVANTDVSGG